jgi:nucleotide-binding universal stress UspA family protein
LHDRPDCRRIVYALIRWWNDSFESEFPVITMILLIMAASALITDAIGVHTVLGAFVAGILIGESPILTRHIKEQLSGLVSAMFMPVFFGVAGRNTDLGAPVARRRSSHVRIHNHRQRRQVRWRLSWWNAGSIVCAGIVCTRLCNERARLDRGDRGLLIVIGVAHRTGSAQLFLGHTATSLLEHADTAIILVLS